MKSTNAFPFPQNDRDWRRVLERTRVWPMVDPFRGLFHEAPRPAAVLVPVLQREGQWHLLFIQRAHHDHDPHSGQVSFPGGRHEDADGSFVETALRETHEEIGLPPSKVVVWGSLPTVRTASNYLVFPVVGRVPWPFPFRPAPYEVDHIFTVPLAWLARPENLTVHWRSAGSRTIPVFYFQPYEGRVIWGATARVVLLLLAALNVLDPALRAHLVPGHASGTSSPVPKGDPP